MFKALETRTPPGSAQDRQGGITQCHCSELELVFDHNEGLFREVPGAIDGIIINSNRR